MFHLLYIDPGSSSLFIQFLIAIVVGVGVFFKNVRLYISSFFRRKSDKKTEA